MQKEISDCLATSDKIKLIAFRNSVNEECLRCRRGNNDYSLDPADIETDVMNHSNLYDLLIFYWYKFLKRLKRLNLPLGQAWESLRDIVNFPNLNVRRLKAIS